jgi:predicted nucleic acid-binding protein
MGLILDSSFVISGERRGETVEQFIERIIHATGDQDAALSAVGLSELVHGIGRAPTQELRRRSIAFLDELLADLTVYPYTKEMAILAGRLDGEQRNRGVTIPLADLFIGATALVLGYSVLMANIRHFERIPNLSVVKL